jgi:hypothetical protein
VASSTSLHAPPDHRPSQSGPAAAAETERNFATNLAALARTQPRLRDLVLAVGPVGQPTFSRDGSLTFFDGDGKWWRQCSVPIAAAEAMLRPLDLNGRVACFLAPTLAAHLRVALTKLRRDQAIIATGSDAADVRVMLACDDFSGDIAAHRLWFAIGEDWPAELRHLLEERPGLATPSQFIRLPITPEDTVEPMIAAAGKVFSEANASRARTIARLRADGRLPTNHTRLCVIAPSHFRLWDDAGAVLAETLAAQADRPGAAAEVVAFDPDDPARSSAAALTTAAEGCRAILAADMSRPDLAGVVPAEMPWVTWVTRPASIPAFDAVGARDALVVADPSWRQHATAAGWPADRVAVGGWPAVSAGGPVPPPPSPVLAVVSDTRPVVMPEALAEFSSHAMLWRHIVAELSADPFALGEGPAQYLQRRMKQSGIGAEGFDAGVFLERLILPTYEQAVARLILHAGLPLRLYGAGWDAIEELTPRAAGGVASRADLLRIRRDVTALVDCSAGFNPPPLHRLGRPVVARAMDRRHLLAAAKQALGQGLSAETTASPVTLPNVLALLRS